MTTFQDLPLDQVKPHPLNIRHTAAADDDMVASIKVHGLLEPMIVAPDGDTDGFFIIAGHRRADGCRKAGLTTVPAIVRDDLVTHAQVIEAMLIENGHRQDLTPVEEAEGYEQLQLFGYKPKDIARAVGRNVATVKSRLKLNTLPDTSREKLHGGQLTLADAEALLEFADEPEVLSRLESKIGTGNFRYEISRAREERQMRERRAQVASEISGGFSFDPLEFDGGYPTWNTETGPCALEKTGLPEAASHVECGRIYWPPSLWQNPFLVCTNPGRHPKPAALSEDEAAAEKARADRDAEWERQRAAREQELAEQRAAARVRVDHLAKHFAGLFTTKTVSADQLAALRVLVPMRLSIADGTFDENAYMHAMGIDSTSWWAISEVHAAEVAVMPPAKFLHAYAALLAAEAEAMLSGPSVPASLAAWDWLTGTGYELSDVDEALYAQAKEHDDEAA